MSLQLEPNPRRKYTSERLEEIVNLWKDGTPAPQIGARFGITRNAVISLIHRYTDHRKRKRLREAKANRVPKPRRAYIIGNGPKRIIVVKPNGAPIAPEPYIVHPDDPPLVHSVDGLEPSHCRWPIGDPQSLDSFGFCGHPRDGHQSYCAKHKHRAVQQPQEKDKLVAAE